MPEEFKPSVALRNKMRRGDLILTPSVDAATRTIGMAEISSSTLEVVPEVDRRHDDELRLLDGRLD